MFNTHIERDLAAVKVAELHRRAAAYRMSHAAAGEERVDPAAVVRLRVLRPAPVAVDAVQDCCA